MGSPADPVPSAKEKEELPLTWADRVWNSRAREALFESAQDILRERPILGFFILFQVCFAAIPILLFLGFATLVVCVTLLAASGFVLFWIALALALGLIPALLFTSIVATMLFAFTAMSVAVGWVGYNWWEGNEVGGQQGLKRLQDVVKKEGNGGF